MPVVLCAAAATPAERRRFSIRSSRRRSRIALLLAAAASGIITVPLRAADVTSTWINAANGIWSTQPNWNSAFFPNNGNGGFTYAALIGATGSPYTVTLNSAVTINDLTLNSANATLVNSGTLSVLSSPINLQAGTFQLLGGSINGGTINFSGGTLVFTGSGGVLNGTNISGNLQIAQSSGRVELRNGADLTGNATLSASGSILN